MTLVRRNLLIAAAAAAVLIVAWYLLAWSPQGKKLSQARAADQHAQAQVVGLLQQQATLRAIENRLPIDQALLAKLQAAVPSNISLDTALQQLNEAAQHAGVSISSISPSTASTGAAGSTASTGTAGTAASSGLPTLGITMAFTGNNGQVMSMLGGLAAMPRLLVVDHVGLSGTSSVTANVTARMFYTAAAHSG